MSHTLVWVDIPTQDLSRAINFYSAVLNCNMTKEDKYPPFSFSVFPHEDNDVAGCLVEEKNFKPSTHGILIYLNVNGRIDDAIAKVTQHGGKILEPKQQIGPWGYRVIIEDTEGNRVGLHSM